MWSRVGHHKQRGDGRLQEDSLSLQRLLVFLGLVPLLWPLHHFHLHQTGFSLPKRRGLRPDVSSHNLDIIVFSFSAFCFYLLGRQRKILQFSS